MGEDKASLTTDQYFRPTTSSAHNKKVKLRAISIGATEAFSVRGDRHSLPRFFVDVLGIKADRIDPLIFR